jgi:hypothetical protein
MAFGTVSPEASRVLFFLVAIVFVSWFAAGMFLNVRRGNAVARWLQEGLPLLGERTTLRWLGSSGIELKIAKPRKPLMQVEIFILLEPRDIPFLWAYFHFRGRRDLLLLRCQTSGAPPFQLEAADPDAWSTRRVPAETGPQRWSPLASPAGTTIAARGEGRLEPAAGLLSLATGCPLPLVRLAVRRAAPQLEVQWQLGSFQGVSARRVLETVLQIAGEL